MLICYFYRRLENLPNVVSMITQMITNYLLMEVIKIIY